MINSLPRSILAASLVFAACGGDGLTLPPDGAAANIEVIWGNGQDARVGSTLPDSVVVEVTDTRGRPVADAEVIFEFTADGSTAEPATVSTDANGIAWSHLTLGTRVGPVNGMVRVPVEAGVTPVEAPITATALPGDANGIALFSGNDQSAAVGNPLPAPLVVAVTDASGNPIPGIPIQWSVTGGGSLSETSNLTDANGQASVTRTLGGTAGPQTTIATAIGLAGSPVTFAHTATAGSATGVVKFSGDNQSAQVGTALAQPLVVQVLDAQSNPIPNRAVTWVTGDGSVNPENSTTDAQGFASTSWTLGSTPGAKTANAVVSGLDPATFNATATAGAPSASASSVSASPTSIAAGSGTSTITVTVRDASNNPVSGVSVTVSSSGSGNTVVPASASSGADGVATFSFSSTVAETKNITATAGGVAITDQATVTVQKASSTVEITSDDPDPSSVNEQVTVEFTVRGTEGTPTGSVTITVSGGSETCSESLTDGSGSCTLTFLAPGTGSDNRRVITATYTGDARFSGDTDTENHVVRLPVQVSSTVEITSIEPEPSIAGEDVTVGFTVSGSGGTPTGDVVITVSGGPETCTGTLSNGSGSCTVAMTESGTRRVRATYSGDARFSGDTDEKDHRVNPPVRGSSTTEITGVMPEPSTSGQEITVTFTVTGEGGGTPTGTVTIFSLQETGGCEVPVSQGSCSFVLNEATTHQLRASYSGDAQFESSSDPDGRDHVVNP